MPTQVCCSSKDLPVVEEPATEDRPGCLLQVFDPHHDSDDDVEVTMLLLVAMVLLMTMVLLMAMLMMIRMIVLLFASPSPPALPSWR